MIGKTKTKIYTRLAAMLLVYVLLKFFGGSFGRLALYPVTLLVTFLHEFGHALGAIVSGGAVKGLQVNLDGSGFTQTRGGNPGLILMGGYLGSVLLGNLLLRIGLHHGRSTQATLLVLAGVMVFAGFVWAPWWQAVRPDTDLSMGALVSTLILIGFAALLVFLALRTSWDQDILLFFGVAAVLYILQDFNQGPSSDLAQYERYIGLFSARVWMYVWLVLAVAITFINLRPLFRNLKL
jgi:hypothetical protein